MKKNEIDQGKILNHGHAVGVSDDVALRERARELAVISGRTASEVLDSDMEQARREMTGEEGLVPSATAAENLTEDDRWNPVADSSGHKTPNLSASDEQTAAQSLVEEGVEEAEQDQMIQAARLGLKRDQQ
jgi:hypothetical protein